MSFPEDRYTPHGYLDNPLHSWILNPIGVLRTDEGVSLGWFFPCHPAQQYTALLRVGCWVGNEHYWSPDELAAADLHSPHHSKNLLSFRWQTREATCTVTYFLIHEHALGCRLDATGDGQGQTSLEWLIAGLLWRRAWASRRWEQGVMCRWNPAPPQVAGAEAGSLHLRSYSEGITLSLQTSVKPARHRLFASEDALAIWAEERTGGKEGRLSAPRRDTVAGCVNIPVLMGSPGPEPVWVVLGRGHTAEQAEERARAGLREADAALAARRENDERFWSLCPRLEGDWPDEWRRGWVYDWETLRMNVRPPVGIYRHPWDAMQIQQPRTVLAEAMLDSLMMHYADAETAKQVALGTFADAPRPQVPCSREDGSFNMTAEDGSECGTSPAWCWPFHCLEAIYLSSADSEWLSNIYAYLEAYLDWWLAHRTDQEGWAVNKCSWESGQDASARFAIPQLTGGEVTDFVRPVDSQAAISYAAKVMEDFARVLGRDAAKWRAVREDFRSRTLKMKVGGSFRDFDGRTGKPVLLEDYQHDVTWFSPLMCDILDDNEAQTLAAGLAYFLDNPKHWMEWASFFFQFCECAWRAGARELLARAAFFNLDRVWRRSDRRDWTRGEPLPGVAVECWGLDKPIGAEGYGWAATLPLAVIRGILGFREAQWGFWVAPSVPAEMMREGTRYRLRNLRWRDIQVDLSYSPTLGGVEAEVALCSPTERQVQLLDTGGHQLDEATLAPRVVAVLRHHLENFASYRVEVT